MSCYFQSRFFLHFLLNIFFLIFLGDRMPLLGIMYSNYCYNFHCSSFELQISKHSYFYLLILPLAAFLKNEADSSEVLITK